jgi:hypothetical protein
MAELMLPRWIITSKCMPFGRRQGPKPVLVIEREVSRLQAIRTGDVSSKGVYQPVEVPGLFKNWEYRFWAMIVTNPGNPGKASILAECRACGNTQNGDTPSRQLHFAKGGCTKRLCAAYDLLIKDSKCLVCDHKTIMKKWGVPLCSSACTQAWCESEPQPKALAEALALVGDQGWA